MASAVCKHESGANEDRTDHCAGNWGTMHDLFVVFVCPLESHRGGFPMGEFVSIMMFNVENVLRALDQGKPDVSIWLLPTTFMLSAVMDSNLAQSKTELLVTGGGLLLVLQTSVYQFFAVRTCSMSVENARYESENGNLRQNYM